MVRVEELTESHFREWYADWSTPHAVGYALRGEDGKLVCIGGYWFVASCAYAFFDSRGRPPLRVHRLAHILIEVARRSGITTLYAELDERKPRARAWLERFEFEPFGLAADGVEKWRLDLGGPGDNDTNGGRHSHERHGVDTARQCGGKSWQVQP